VARSACTSGGGDPGAGPERKKRDVVPVLGRMGITLPIGFDPCSITKVSLDPSVDRVADRVIGKI